MSISGEYSESSSSMPIPLRDELATTQASARIRWMAELILDAGSLIPDPVDFQETVQWFENAGLQSSAGRETVDIIRERLRENNIPGSTRSYKHLLEEPEIRNLRTIAAEQPHDEIAKEHALTYTARHLDSRRRNFLSDVLNISGILDHQPLGTTAIEKIRGWSGFRMANIGMDITWALTNDHDISEEDRQAISEHSTALINTNTAWIYLNAAHTILRGVLLPLDYETDQHYQTDIEIGVNGISLPKDTRWFMPSESRDHLAHNDRHYAIKALGRDIRHDHTYGISAQRWFVDQRTGIVTPLHLLLRYSPGLQNSSDLFITSDNSVSSKLEEFGKIPHKKPEGIFVDSDNVVYRFNPAERSIKRLNPVHHPEILKDLESSHATAIEALKAEYTK